MAPGPNTPTTWLSRTLSSGMVLLASAQELAVGIGDLQDCGVLDIAHRAAGGESSIVRVEGGEQRVERIVQQRLVARITVVEALGIGALIIGQRLPGIQQLVDRDAKGGVTSNYVGGWRAVEDHLHDHRAGRFVSTDLAGICVGSESRD